MRLWQEGVGATIAVLEGYEAGVAAGILAPNMWSELAVVSLTEDEMAWSELHLTKLGKGERTSLAVAVMRRCLFVSDDFDARTAARQLSVAVTGTIGILASSVDVGLLTLVDANHLLAQMIPAGY